MLDPGSIVASAGSGALIGFILGILLRRLLSFVITTFGLFFLGLSALVYLGLATVDFEGLLSLIHQLFTTGISVSSPLISQFGGPSFSIPFFLGLLGGSLKGSGVQHSVSGSRRRVLR